jgi:sodium/bile acid cotransporter 7
MKTIKQDHIIMASNDENQEIVTVDLGGKDHDETSKPPSEMSKKADAEDQEVNTTNDDVDAAVATADQDQEQSWIRSFCRRLLTFYCTYDFPIHILIGIGLAQAYPPLGAEYLKPKITASWVATGIIFFLSGLGLKTNDLLKVAFRRLYFNVFVEGFNFGVVSLIVFGVSRALASSGIIPQPLADGLAMAACLPMSINAVIILTTAANGDEAAAIFHCTLGNVCGIFLSPLLIVLYLPDVTADVDLPTVFLDLTLKVIVPLICGQLVHITIPSLREFYYAHKKIFKKIQESSLVYIV